MNAHAYVTPGTCQYVDGFETSSSAEGNYRSDIIRSDFSDWSVSFSCNFIRRTLHANYMFSPIPLRILDEELDNTLACNR